MDVFEQQKKLYSDPHFGGEKRGVLTRLFEAVKSALTPTAVLSAKAHSFQLHSLKHPLSSEDHSNHIETFFILRNGVSYGEFFDQENACQAEIIILRKQYPNDSWTYLSNAAIQSKELNTAVA